MEIGQLVTKNDLLQMKVDIIAALKESLQSSSEKKRWLKSKEMMQLFGISASGLQNLRISGKIPCSKLGGIFLYDYTEVMKILEVNKSKAAANSGTE